MHFYTIYYSSYENSDKLVVYSEDFLNDDELLERVVKASKDLLKDSFEDVGTYHYHNIEVNRLRVEALIDEGLYPYLEKYNLHKVESAAKVGFWGWNDLLGNRDLWKESGKEDQILSEELKEYVKELKNNA